MLKTIKFVLFCVILLNLQVHSQWVGCGFGYFRYSINPLPYYTCNLDTRNLNYGIYAVSIFGQHMNSKTNDDVEFLVPYLDQQLHTFSALFCQTFKNLKAVNLNKLKLKSIDENSFWNCRNLEYLVIANNPFPKNTGNILDYTQNLVDHKQAAKIQLTSLPENLLANQKELRSLELHSNLLMELPAGIFRNLKKLQRLELEDNQIQVINPVWFENLESLTYLNLANNLITEIPSLAFKSMKDLQGLYINQNKIDTLYSDSFIGLDSLKVLDVHQNQIIVLPKGVFKPLKNLEDVNFGFNNLTTVHSDSFGVHPFLRNINLWYNKIVTIDPKIGTFPNLALLDLVPNPCSKNLYESNQGFRNCTKNYKTRTLSGTTVTGTESDLTCGKSPEVVSTIIGGTEIKHGDYPW